MFSSLDADIASFTADKKNLLRKYLDKFVIFYHGKLQGAYDSFDAAADAAVTKFGSGPYLIRQVISEEQTSIKPNSFVFRTA